MATLDYKIVEEEIKNGSVVRQRVRFYEGAVTTENEMNLNTGLVEPVNRYRRTLMVEEVEYTYGN